jgi:hypothetical protein
VLDAEGGSPDSGGTAEAAAAAAARMAELKVGLRIRIRIGSFNRVSGSGSGSGSRRAKMTQKVAKKLRNYVRKCWMFSLRAEGFFCYLEA